MVVLSVALASQQQATPRQADKPAGGEGKAATESLADNANENELAKRLRLLETENSEMKADKAARSLLESMGREVTEIRVKTVKALADDPTRKALIETWPKQDFDVMAGRPRQAAPLLESKDGGEVLTGEKLIAGLKRS